MYHAITCHYSMFMYEKDVISYLHDLHPDYEIPLRLVEVLK
jgi:hypothetical protein